MRPSRIWKSLPSDIRVSAARAFWQDDESPDVSMQQMEALVLIAQRLKFRAKSVQAFDDERRAKALARITDVSDGIATRALVAFHFAERRPLMAAFLDALGVAHDNGLIEGDEGIPAPAAADLERAVTAVRGSFPESDVELYLRTLLTVDGDTWENLRSHLPETA